MNKFIKTNFSLLLILSSLVSCGDVFNSQPSSSVPEPEVIKIKDPEARSKSYFANDVEASSYEIDMKEYVDTNGRDDVEYTVVVSNEDALTVTVDGDIVKVTVNDVQGNFNLSVEVRVAGKVKFVVSFPIKTTKISKVACIGDSLTEGHSWSSQAYPVYLKENLGTSINVGNYGRNGANVTSYGGSGSNYQYTKLSKYTDSKNFKPNVAVIMLGTNDATGWANAEATFETLYRSLINDYLSLNAQVVLVVSPPTIMPNAFNIPNEVIRDSVNPIQRKVAEELNIPLVDAREAFENHPDGVRSLIRSEKNDNVHLSVKGAQFIAELISNKIKTL